MMDSKKNMKLRIGFLVFVAVVILILLVAGGLIDSDKFQNEVGESAMQPYIELPRLDDEQFLVGDGVIEWLSGETEGEDLYNKYSSMGKVYSAKSVMIRYSIYDIPTNIEVKHQSVEFSEDISFTDVKKIDLPGNKRNVSFDYLYADKTYYYRVTAYLSDNSEISAEGQFKTADTPRIISAEGVWNMRDIGGVKTIYGKKLKQGLAYRGVELDGAVYSRYCITDFAANILTEELGIRTEIDLRGEKENMKDMLGPDVNHNVYQSIYAYSDSMIPYYFDNYRQLFSDLANEDNYPVYIHCSYGKDRTGTVIFLLQLLLGVSEEDAYKEWELSVLLDGVLDYIPMKDYIKALNQLEGDTMQEKVEKHLLSIGVTRAEIENIRNIMIEDYASKESNM